MNDIAVEAVDVEHVLMIVAVDYARKFYKYTEREDIAQELRLWVHQHPQTVSRWLVEEDGERPLRRSLQNAAHDFGLRMKAQVSGYTRDEFYFYSTGELENLLPLTFDPEALLNPPKILGGSRTKKVLNEATHNWATTLMDVSRAYESLCEKDRNVLRWLHVDDITQREIAEDCDVTQQTVSAWNKSALTRMQKFLGGRGPGSFHPREDGQPCECVGSRKVITSAAARAITQNQYDSE